MANEPELAEAANILVADYMDVSKTDRVVITTDTATDACAVEAVLAAVVGAGAEVAVVKVVQLPYQGMLADPYVPESLVNAVEGCSVWIDLTFPYLAGSSVHDRAMKQGKTRYLLGADVGGNGLRRLFGGVDLDSYQSAFDVYAKHLGQKEGARIRVTNSLGTDVSFDLGKPAYAKPRRAVDPGTYLVPGSYTLFPEIESVSGEIITEAGFHEYYTPFAAPVRIVVDGRIRTVDGGGTDRAILDRSLRRAGGGEYGYVIHFTFAMHPAARLTGQSFVEDSRVHGSNAVGLGLPWWEPGGGENHPDVVVSNQSIYVNDELLIDAGEAVAPKELVAASELLIPRVRNGAKPDGEK
jgi:2,5-dihydroxypyridine 5,6-dioxygenase